MHRSIRFSLTALLLSSLFFSSACSKSPSSEDSPSPTSGTSQPLSTDCSDPAGLSNSGDEDELSQDEIAAIFNRNNPGQIEYSLRYSFYPFKDPSDSSDPEMISYEGGDLVLTCNLESSGFNEVGLMLFFDGRAQQLKPISKDEGLSYFTDSQGDNPYYLIQTFENSKTQKEQKAANVQLLLDAADAGKHQIQMVVFPNPRFSEDLYQINPIFTHPVGISAPVSFEVPYDGEHAATTEKALNSDWIRSSTLNRFDFSDEEILKFYDDMNGYYRFDTALISWFTYKNYDLEQLFRRCLPEEGLKANGLINPQTGKFDHKAAEDQEIVVFDRSELPELSFEYNMVGPSGTSWYPFLLLNNRPVELSVSNDPVDFDKKSYQQLALQMDLTKCPEDARLMFIVVKSSLDGVGDFTASSDVLIK
ncbi:MAG: hypothetical protein Q4P72_05755 [Eubacteriales bacterium]|nr:hypothetical protein [Eubacteriales bacterium]